MVLHGTETPEKTIIAGREKLPDPFLDCNWTNLRSGGGNRLIWSLWTPVNMTKTPTRPRERRASFMEIIPDHERLMQAINADDVPALTRVRIIGTR
jgi:hypothetical protein